MKWFIVFLAIFAGVLGIVGIVGLELQEGEDNKRWIDYCKRR